MKYSKNLQLNMPELADQYNLDHWNENNQKLDETIHNEIQTRTHESEQFNLELTNEKQARENGDANITKKLDALQKNFNDVTNSLGTASTKDAGSAQGNVPVVGTDLGQTDNNVVVTDTQGNLKPAEITYGNMMSASNAGALCSTVKTTQAKDITLAGFSLYDGVTVKVMFTNGNSADNPTLNVNNTGAIPIKVVKAGAKVVPVTHTGYWRGASTTSDEMWQPYTILEFMYDGADWVIVGNPTVESYFSNDKSYEVKADGLIEQWIIYDNGADATQLKSNVNFSIIFSDANYSFSLSSSSTHTFIMGKLGAGNRGKTSLYIQFDGASSSDKARYLCLLVKGY